MKSPQISILSTSDYITKDTPEYFNKFVNTMVDKYNKEIRDLSQILNSNITIQDNIDAIILELKLTATDLPFKLSNPIKKQPENVSIASIKKDIDPYETITDAVSIQWQYESGNIKIYDIAGIDATSLYIIKLLII